MCDLCNDTGYVMQDIGTAIVPDYVEIPCRCNPEPTDEDYDDNWVPGTAWEDFHRTPPLRPDPSEYALPAHLLA